MSSNAPSPAPSRKPKPVPERFQVLGDSLNETGARVSGRPRDVRRDDTVLGGEQRVILFRRLVHKNVKPRSGDAATDWNLVMATVMLAMLPPAAVVVLMQRWFVKGLVETEK